MKKVLICGAVVAGMLLAAGAYAFASFGDSYISDFMVRRAESVAVNNASRAESYYRLALRLNANNAETRLALSELYEGMGQTHKAEQVIAEGIDLFPSNYNLHLNLSALYIRCGRLSEAVEVLDAAMQTNGGMQIAQRRPVVSASPQSGSYTRPVAFEIEDEPHVVYYITTDGSRPTAHSAGYAEPIELIESCTIRVVAVRGDIPSREYTFTYDVSEAVQSVWSALAVEDAGAPPALDHGEGWPLGLVCPHCGYERPKVVIEFPQ